MTVTNTRETFPVPGRRTIGALLLRPQRCRFRVWAPNASRVSVRLFDHHKREVTLDSVESGYHETIVDDCPAGTRYAFRVDDGAELPDPASRSQPDGVHAASEVVDPNFSWSQTNWLNPPLSEHIFYELHVGTFTEEGTFDAIIARLGQLRELGITAIQLMPVAEFPGRYNWGYDGVSLFAAHHAYGGVDALKQLVDACHQRGLAVYLDVVYNHLGPEGNYLSQFGPYFTDHYHTPWGDALNFDGPDSDHIREFFIQNALYWTIECQMDGLRLDAVHAIVDNSARPFIEELTEAVHNAANSCGRRIHLIAESAANDSRLLRERAIGGIGMDGQWNDDFHHAVHALLTGEQQGYYKAFGSIEHLARSFREGYTYTGQYSSYYRRRHGRPSADVPPERFVVFAQNHDQVGNRAQGDRLITLVSFEQSKLAAALVVLSPYVPMLFMGEEYGEQAPFLYFADHTDKHLIDAVRKGRRNEFKGFEWSAPPPDPFDPDTVERSRLNWSQRQHAEHQTLLACHGELIRLRKAYDACRLATRAGLHTACFDDEHVLVVYAQHGDQAIIRIFNCSGAEQEISASLDHMNWVRVFDSNAEHWRGPGARTPARIGPALHETISIGPHAAAVYVPGEQ